jgi:hypothetical protein
VSCDTAEMSIQYRWRGDIVNDEMNALHAEAFETRLFLSDEWNCFCPDTALDGSLPEIETNSLAS